MTNVIKLHTVNSYEEGLCMKIKAALRRAEEYDRLRKRTAAWEERLKADAYQEALELYEEWGLC
jgi:hypothetical protein